MFIIVLNDKILQQNNIKCGNHRNGFLQPVQSVWTQFTVCWNSPAE